MDASKVIETAIDRFERLLRWVYPGLLFWLVLPIALTKIDPSHIPANYVNFYEDVPIVGHIAGVLASGFMIYMVERYFLHEGILVGILFFHFLNAGAAVNFRRPGRGQTANRQKVTARNEGRCYPWSNGRLMWVRFGKRPYDDTDPGERAESRFDNYMASRMAAVHAIGSTWLVGLAIWAIGSFVAKNSLFTDWPLLAHLIYLAALFIVLVGWGWHALIAARAEQDHYQPSIGSHSTSTSNP